MKYNYRGESKTLGQWSKKFKLPIQWFKNRMRHGRDMGLNRDESFANAIRNLNPTCTSPNG